MLTKASSPDALSLEPAAVVDLRAEAVFWPIACMMVAMIFLQKFGLTFGDASLGVNAVLMWIGLAWLAVGGVLEIVASRLVLLTAVAAAIVLGLLFNGQELQPTALGILLAMYAGFIFQVRVSHDLASRCLMVFQRAMLVVAAIVLLQQLTQYTIGNRFWPDLDAIVPRALRFPGFAYIHPYHFGSPYLEPNGIFFLEPSVLSAYLAMALILELAWFRRMLHAGAYLAALLGCLAGTGFAMLVLVSPLLLFKLDRRTLLLVVAVAVPLLIGALATSWLAPLLARSGELGHANTSGYARVILPLQSIMDQASDPSRMFFGVGPGQSPKGDNAVQWPFSKLLFEYGMLTAILFHAYLGWSVLGRPPSRTLALAILLNHLFFGGGFVSHSNVMPLLFLCALMMVEPAVDQKEPARKTVAAPLPALRFIQSRSQPAKPATDP